MLTSYCLLTILNGTRFPAHERALQHVSINPKTSFVTRENFPVWRLRDGDNEVEILRKDYKFYSLESPGFPIYNNLPFNYWDGSFEYSL